jgi:hypothetical protein
MTSSKSNDKIRTEAETNSGNATVEKKHAPPEPPKQDYIHVRARRGQATDSHSLAERVSSYCSDGLFTLYLWMFSLTGLIFSHKTMIVSTKLLQRLECACVDLLANL